MNGMIFVFFLYYGMKYLQLQQTKTKRYLLQPWRAFLNSAACFIYLLLELQWLEHYFKLDLESLGKNHIDAETIIFGII